MRLMPHLVVLGHLYYKLDTRKDQLEKEFSINTCTYILAMAVLTKKINLDNNNHIRTVTRLK